MARPTKITDWQIEAVQLMARDGCSLKQAVDSLGVEISDVEITLIMRRATFQRLLWEARHRYFAQLGNDPNFTKESAIGKLISLAQKLEEEGSHDKAAEVILKIAKMEGWVGPESTISVFGELSANDILKIRDQAAKGQLPKVDIN